LQNLKNYSFDKLAGLATEKNEIKIDFVYFYVYSRLYVKNKAILLYGPPGTRKIELAKDASSEIEKNNIRINLYIGGKITIQK
jgi:SpoVK/Ycf46/Vps4 family AAA+-type ATPase